MLLSKSVSKHLPPSSSSSSSRFHFLIQHSSCVLSPGLFWCIHTKRETTRKLGRHRKIMTLLRSEVLRNNRGVKIFNTADYNRFVCDPEWTLHELTYVSQIMYHTDICKKKKWGLAISRHITCLLPGFHNGTGVKLPIQWPQCESAFTATGYFWQIQQHFNMIPKDTFKETSWQFPAKFVAKKLDIFDTMLENLHLCLCRLKTLSQRTPWDSSSNVCGDQNRHFNQKIKMFSRP